MKKPILTIAAAAAFFVPASNAQGIQLEKPLPVIRKGTLSIGTDIGLGSLSTNRISPSQTNVLYDVRLNPSISYFVTDHLMLSGSVSVGLAQNFNYFMEPERYNGASLGISLGSRYYFGSGLTRKGELKKLRFYGEVGIGMEQRWEKWTGMYSGDVAKSSNGTAFANLGAGMNYFLAPNVALEAGLSYNRYFPGFTQADASFQMKLGVRVFLRKK